MHCLHFLESSKLPESSEGEELDPEDDDVGALISIASSFSDILISARASINSTTEEKGSFFNRYCLSKSINCLLVTLLNYHLHYGKSILYQQCLDESKKRQSLQIISS